MEPLYNRIRNLIRNNYANTVTDIAGRPNIRESEAMVEFVIKGLHDGDEIKYVAIPAPHYEANSFHK